jgi:hypothetical protein
MDEEDCRLGRQKKRASALPEDPQPRAWRSARQAASVQAESASVPTKQCIAKLPPDKDAGRVAPDASGQARRTCLGSSIPEDAGHAGHAGVDRSYVDAGSSSMLVQQREDGTRGRPDTMTDADTAGAEKRHRTRKYAKASQPQSCKHCGRVFSFGPSRASHERACGAPTRRLGTAFIGMTAEQRLAYLRTACEDSAGAQSGAHASGPVPAAERP